MRSEKRPRRTPLQVMAHEGPASPIDGVFGALGGGMEETPPNAPRASEICLYIRKLLALMNDHEILKGAPLSVTPDANAPCQRMANEAYRDVLPGDSHTTATEPLTIACGLRMSAMTAPGLLKTSFVAIACRKKRMQRRLLGPGTAYGQQPKSRARR